MAWFTGDIHGDLEDRLEKLLEISDKEEEKNLFIAGDFGLPWEDKWWYYHKLDVSQRICEENNIRVYFVDGNHENFDLLYERYEIYPEENLRYLKPRICHLQRGLIYNIEGLNIFAFGGAMSTDDREGFLGKGYWREELPSTAEIETGRKNLKDTKEIDVILTHAAPRTVICNYKKKLGNIEERRFVDPVAYVLDDYYKIARSKKKQIQWINGHYHVNIVIPENKKNKVSFRMIYEDFHRIINQRKEA